MMRWTCAVLLAAACSSADKQVSVLSFEPPNACSTVGRLTVVNSRTAPASIDSVVRLSGVAVSAPPFLDDPSPIFTLALPEQLPPEQTAIPVRYTPSGNDPRHVSTASLKVVISGVPVQLNLSNAPIGEELAGVPAFVDLGAIPPDGVFAPLQVPPGGSASLIKPAFAPSGFSVRQLGVSALFVQPLDAGNFEGLVETRFACVSTTTRYLATGVDALLSAPSTLDFGPVAVGLTRTLSLRIENASFDAVSLAPDVGPSVVHSILAPDAGLVVRGARRDEAERLIPGAVELAVRFAPNGVGASSSTVTLGVANSLPIQLLGKGAGPDIEVDAGTLDFGALTLPASASIAIRNVGVQLEPPSVAVNLHLGVNGQLPTYDLVRVSGAATVAATLVTPYDSTVGLAPTETAVLRVDAAPGASEHLLHLFSDDPDEPEVTVRIIVR